MERRSRPRVAVDVDEVLCEFASMIVRWHNRVYGGVGPHKAMLCVGDFVSYEFKNVWGGTTSDAEHKVHEFFASPEFAGTDPAEPSSGGGPGSGPGSTPPIPVRITVGSGTGSGLPGIAGALRVLRAHVDAFEFVVVTSRQLVIEPISRSWLALHFPGVFSELAFGNHYGMEGVKRSKPAMCADLGASILIDDSLEYATQCATALKRVLLFGEYPWNAVRAGTLPDNVVRCRDWNAVHMQLTELRGGVGVPPPLTVAPHVIVAEHNTKMYVDVVGRQLATNFGISSIRGRGSFASDVVVIVAELVSRGYATVAAIAVDPPNGLWYSLRGTHKVELWAILIFSAHHFLKGSARLGKSQSRKELHERVMGVGGPRISKSMQHGQ